MARVYSTVLYHDVVPDGFPAYGFACPEGQVLVVRQILVVGADGRKLAAWIGTGGNAPTLAFQLVIGSVGSLSTSAEWQGRIVLEPTDRLVFSAPTEEVGVYVAGYRLTGS